MALALGYEIAVGIAIALILTFVFYQYLFKKEFFLSMSAGLALAEATTLLPYWTISIAVLLLGIYLYQEFHGGEGG